LKEGFPILITEPKGFCCTQEIILQGKLKASENNLYWKAFSTVLNMLGFYALNPVEEGDMGDEILHISGKISTSLVVHLGDDVVLTDVDQLGDMNATNVFGLKPLECELAVHQGNADFSTDFSVDESISANQSEEMTVELVDKGLEITPPLDSASKSIKIKQRIRKSTNEVTLPASYEKSLKHMRRAKECREANIIIQKSLEMRHYDTVACNKNFNCNVIKHIGDCSLLRSETPVFATDIRNKQKKKTYRVLPKRSENYRLPQTEVEPFVSFNSDIPVIDPVVVLWVSSFRSPLSTSTSPLTSPSSRPEVVNTTSTSPTGSSKQQSPCTPFFSNSLCSQLSEGLVTPQPSVDMKSKDSSTSEWHDSNEAPGYTKTEDLRYVTPMFDNNQPQRSPSSDTKDLDQLAADQLQYVPKESEIIKLDRNLKNRTSQSAPTPSSSATRILRKEKELEKNTRKEKEETNKKLFWQQQARRTASSNGSFHEKKSFNDNHKKLIAKYQVPGIDFSNLEGSFSPLQYHSLRQHT
jgi:hypothetical protein